MIDIRPYVKFVEGMNAIDPKGLGLSFMQDRELNGQYSLSYDSFAERWTLVSETDEAPELCSFNRQAPECTGDSMCEDCFEVVMYSVKTV